MGVSIEGAAIGILLFVGVGVVVLSCLGVALTKEPFDRLHFVGPASTIGPIAVAAAIVVREGLAVGGIKSLLVAMLLIVSSPVLTHATARAGRVRQFGHWQALDEEVVDSS
jgi:multicomponent Na+:H+ antiporter subunit G